jgi:hypothetical protein
MNVFYVLYISSMYVCMNEFGHTINRSVYVCMNVCMCLYVYMCENIHMYVWALLPSA